MPYSPFIQSLRRMYTAEQPKITLEKLEALKSDGKISEEEYQHIISQ